MTFSLQFNNDTALGYFLDGHGGAREVDAAIFLPLGFLTGLFGINIGGIPGTEYPQAFLIFIGILIIVVVLQVFLFRWKKWM